MNLARFARRRYTPGPTPVEFMSGFTDILGGPNVYLKRDDLLGLAGGGNKTRKLEFLVADALEHGCDTLITCGAVQSNHCRLTLAAAAKEGLKCQLALSEPESGQYDPNAGGNNLLYHLLGVEKIELVGGGDDLAADLDRLAAEVLSEGRKPYTIPKGGSNPLGAVGYVACAQELQYQFFETGLCIDRIVVASGSAGTQAGLIAGLHGLNLSIPVVGIAVSRDKAVQEQAVFELAQETADYVGISGPLGREWATCFDEYWRPGYALPNAEMVEAVQLLARTEGIILDPVYTGKAMAGLIDLSRKKYFMKGENVLFLHTGGAPALYTYVDTFLG